MCFHSLLVRAFTTRLPVLAVFLMAASLLTRAKRAFVSVLLATAASFGLDLGANRDASEKSLAAAYRRVAKEAGTRR